MQIHRGAASHLSSFADSGRGNNAAGLLAYLMSFYIVVAVGKIGDVVPGLHDIPLAKLVAVIAIIIAMRRPRANSAPTWKTIPPAKLTIVFMALTTLSILYSVLRSTTFGVITGTALAVTVTMLLVIKASRSWAPVKAMLQGAVFASIVLVATVFTSKISDSGGYRAGHSRSYDPNDFAFVLVGLLPLVITFGIVSRGLKRVIYFGIAGIVTVAILLTQSRGGLLGLTLDVVTMTFLVPVARFGRLQFRPTRSGIIARAVLLTLIGAVVWQSLPDSARIRLDSVTELGSDYNANVSEGGRLAIWTRNLPLVLERPWGYGAGAFGAVDGLFAGGRYRAPHNTLLQALIELGVPGFLLFICTIVSSLRYLRMPRGRHNEKTSDSTQDEPRAFARALGIGLLGLCVSGLFLSELFSNVIWSFVTLSCAVGIVRRLPMTKSVGPVALTPPQRIAIRKRAVSARVTAKPTR